MIRLMTVLSVSMAGAAFAGPPGNVFNDRSAFETAAGNAGIALQSEGFEGLPVTGSAAEFGFGLDGFDVSAINEGFEFLPPLGIQGLTGGGGTFATEGVQHLNVGSLFSGSQNNDVVVTFTFASPINALFWDITDLKGLDQAPSPRAFLETDGGDVITLLDGQDPSQDLLSIGLIDPAGFTTVTIRATAGDSFGFDAVSFGVIPTPGAFALAGVAGIAATRRRR